MCTLIVRSHWDKSIFNSIILRKFCRIKWINCVTLCVTNELFSDTQGSHTDIFIHIRVSFWTMSINVYSSFLKKTWRWFLISFCICLHMIWWWSCQAKGYVLIWNKPLKLYKGIFNQTINSFLLFPERVYHQVYVLKEYKYFRKTWPSYDKALDSKRIIFVSYSFDFSAC